MALGILSGISVEGFMRCVQEEDTASLVKVPGVGKKTAERLIVEMRDRIGRSVGVTGAPAAGVTAPGGGAAQEAQSALVALGYRPAEAARLVTGVEAAGLSTEEIIRRALQSLSRS
jgi:Holliday junction DNA helicase RuvA